MIGKQFVDLLDAGEVVSVLGDVRGSPRQVMRVRLNKRVCEKCNNQWMARLDDDCFALLGPSMSVGAGVSLDPTNQRMASFWATKIALLSELYVEQRAAPMGKHAAHIPADNFTLFYEKRDRRSCPPGTQVWIGAAETGVYPFWNQAGSFVATVDPEETVGYCATFCVGRVLFQVHGHDLFWPHGSTQRLKIRPLDVPSEYLGRLIPIWKRRDLAVRWPPPGKPFARSELNDLAGWPIQGFATG